MHINSNNMQKSIILIIAISILLLTVTLFFHNKVSMMLRTEVENSLLEVTTQNSLLLKEKIRNTFSSLSTLSTSIGQLQKDYPAAIAESMRKEKNQNKFIRMGAIDLTGKAIYGDDINLDTAPYLKQVMRGQKQFTHLYLSPFGEKDCFLFAVPIYADAESTRIKGALYGIYYSVDLQTLFEVKSFGGQGQSFLVDKNGDLIIYLTDIDKTQKLNYLFANLGYKNAAEEKTLAHIAELPLNLNRKLSNIFSSGHADNINYSYGSYKWVSHFNLDGYGEQYVACVLMHDLDEWYVLGTIIPATIVTNQTTTILSWLSLALAIFAGTLLSIFAYLEITHAKNRQYIFNLAYIDSLTKLGNWAKFKDDANKVFKSKSVNYAYVCIDIDNFKLINEIWGYQYGDNLLRYIADYLKKECQAGELVCRVNADIFALLLKNPDNNLLISRVELLLDKISSSYYKKYHYEFTFSCGINYIDKVVSDISLIADAANIARHTTKNNRHNSIFVFNNNMKNQMLSDKNLEDDMQYALDHNEFLLYLQPKFSLNPEGIVGAEALIRWQHSQKGLMNPIEFIPLFEKNGTIIKLDFYVLDKVCKHLRHCLNNELDIYPISVNLSRITLVSNRFVQNALEIVKRYELPIGLIEFELTETSTHGDIDFIVEILTSLHNEGFGISMDDFGTGYSSLGLLKQMPIDVIKLDKSFLYDWEIAKDDPKTKGVIKTAITMAKNLHISIVAEGVETLEQVEFLRDMGCNIIQGYYFAKPMPESDYKQLLSGLTVKAYL